MVKYNPISVEELKKNAVLFWPSEVIQKEERASIIPVLLETQYKFISILHVSDSSPIAWKEILKNTSGISANLFLKHLMVLSDVGGEKTKRFKSELPKIFLDSKMQFSWHGTIYEYKLRSFLDKIKDSWNNHTLGVDGKGILLEKPLSTEIEDVIMLLLYGSSATNPGVPDEIINKCMIGTLLGNKTEIETFVRQRYIWVSRITGGATTNAMGYLAEEYVKEILDSTLPNWDFSKKKIPGISQNDGRTDITFDLVAESPNGKCCAIELSFQVTTNSVIERKAGQAQARYELLYSYGHQIAYIIDGAGNFERRSALSTILKYSDCTVTFNKNSLDILVKFLKSLEK